MDNGQFTFNHTYTNTGNYTLTVSYNECSSNATVTVVSPTTIHPCAGTPHNGSDYQQNGLNGDANDGFEIATNDGIISVEDYDGNVYSVTEINGRCWMAQNLRCAHSPKSGSDIVINGDVASYTSKAAYWYYDMEAPLSAKDFGLLYNWCAAMDTARPENYIEVPNVTTDDNDVWAFTETTTYHRGICPKGWHLPSKGEFDTLMISILDDPSDRKGSNGVYSYYHIAAKLAGGCDWLLSNECDGHIGSVSSEDCESQAVPGNLSYQDRNLYGFNGYPAGVYQGEDDFYGFKYASYFWSSSSPYYNSSSPYYHYNKYAWSFRIKDSASCVINLGDDRTKDHGMSVRCVRDSE
jgi:uncharacterized protein (TIGR02145 family)